MVNIHDFQGRLANFTGSQHIKFYDDQLALAAQIWQGLSSEERQIPQVIEYITLGVFHQLDRSTGFENTKRMISADVKVDERLISQIKKMALLRGLDRWQSSGNIAEAKRRIIAAYEQDSVELNLGRLDLSSLPAEIGQLTALERLHLVHNKLTALPDEIGQLRALNHLDLSDNQLTVLPPEIGQLTTLIVLDLCRNKLKDLPPTIGQLRALTSLTLYINRLTFLRPEIGQLRDLTDLSLFNNKLTDLPAEIGQLRALKYLDLSKNRLSVLPPEIGQLRALTYLSLFNTSLKVLPPEIGQLTALIHLSVSSNQLTVLPPEIGQLRALTGLDVSYSQLRVLPSEIGQLRALTCLRIFYNQLASLPISMGLLTNLESLVFHHNPLRELPLSLGQLNLLTHLDTEGTQLDKDVVQTILAQCQAKRDVEASTLLPIKLVAWKAIGESDIDLSLFEPFTDHQKFDLFEWLVRLEKTRDFSDNQKSLAAFVCGMLKDVISNKEFQEMFFAQVEANNQSCEDRAAMSFNEVFVSWKIICLSPDATLKEKLLLLASAAKTNALRRFLDFKISKREGQEHESVEIYLYYELLLKEDLQLLTAMRKMSHGQIGQRDWINKDEIVQYVEKGYFIHLFDIPIFQKLFENDLARKDEIKKINEFYHAKLEALPPPKSDAEQLFRQRQIQEERKQAWMQFAKEWFDKVIGEQNLKRPIFDVD